jgi:hypothetical protein
VGFTDTAVAAVLAGIDKLTQPQLRLVLDAAVGLLAAGARCGWLHDTVLGLSEDEMSLLLSLQLKSQGAPAVLAAAGGSLSSSELAALVLTFVPRLEAPDKAECFSAILGTMEVARVLQVRWERRGWVERGWRCRGAKQKPSAAAADACPSSANRERVTNATYRIPAIDLRGLWEPLLLHSLACLVRSQPSSIVVPPPSSPHLQPTGG